jgi:hypothetical protein
LTVTEQHGQVTLYFGCTSVAKLAYGDVFPWP